jgi:hypothetical protein
MQKRLIQGIILGVPPTFLDQICGLAFVTISADPMKRRGLVVGVSNNVQATCIVAAANGVEGLVLSSPQVVPLSCPDHTLTFSRCSSSARNALSERFQITVHLGSWKQAEYAGMQALSGRCSLYHCMSSMLQWPAGALGQLRAHIRVSIEHTKHVD